MIIFLSRIGVNEDTRFEITNSIPPLGESELGKYVEQFECKLWYCIATEEEVNGGYVTDEGEEHLIGQLSGYRLSVYDSYQELDEYDCDSIHPIDPFRYDR